MAFTQNGNIFGEQDGAVGSGKVDVVGQFDDVVSAGVDSGDGADECVGISNLNNAIFCSVLCIQLLCRYRVRRYTPPPYILRMQKRGTGSASCLPQERR